MSCLLVQAQNFVSLADARGTPYDEDSLTPDFDYIEDPELWDGRVQKIGGVVYVPWYGIRTPEYAHLNQVVAYNVLGVERVLASSASSVIVPGQSITLDVITTAVLTSGERVKMRVVFSDDIPSVSTDLVSYRDPIFKVKRVDSMAYQSSQVYQAESIFDPSCQSRSSSRANGW
jgi:hypothetical protein